MMSLPPMASAEQSNQGDSILLPLYFLLVQPVQRAKSRNCFGSNRERQWRQPATIIAEESRDGSRRYSAGDRWRWPDSIGRMAVQGGPDLDPSRRASDAFLLLMTRSAELPADPPSGAASIQLKDLIQLSAPRRWLAVRYYSWWKRFYPHRSVDRARAADQDLSTRGRWLLRYPPPLLSPPQSFMSGAYLSHSPDPRIFDSFRHISLLSTPSLRSRNSRPGPSLLIETVPIEFYIGRRRLAASRDRPFASSLSLAQVDGAWLRYQPAHLVEGIRFVAALKRSQLRGAVCRRITPSLFDEFWFHSKSVPVTISLYELITSDVLRLCSRVLFSCSIEHATLYRIHERKKISDEPSSSSHSTARALFFFALSLVSTMIRVESASTQIISDGWTSVGSRMCCL